MNRIELCIIDRSTKSETLWYRVRFIVIDSATYELVRDPICGQVLSGALSDARKHVPDDMGRVANKMLSTCSRNDDDYTRDGHEMAVDEFEMVEVWARITD